MMPPAPNALHWLPLELSFARSHSPAARIPAALSGMLATSPLGGVIIRHSQSSLTTDTQ